MDLHEPVGSRQGIGKPLKSTVRAYAAGQRLWSVVALVVLVVLVLAVFWQVRGFSLLRYDDDRIITDNPVVGLGLTAAGIRWAFATLSEGNWFPLTWISHMIDVQFFGMKPAGHHLVNLGLHLVVTLLLHWFLVALTGDRWRSLFAAALFAVHPLHVESVAWVNQRKDLLMALFALLTLHAYLADLRQPGVIKKALMIIAFACGLMSKALLVTLPLLLLLLDFWPLGRFYRSGRLASPGALPWVVWRPVFEKLPLLAVALLAGGLAYIAQSNAGGMPFPGLAMSTRCAHTLVSLAWYLVKGLLPTGLAAFYPYPLAGHPVLEVAGAGALLAGVSFVAVAARRRAPALVSGWLWFLVSLLPVAGLVQVGRQAWADRYAYFTLVGLCLVFAWGAVGIASRRPTRIVLGVAVALVVLGYSLASFIQAGSWRNDETLWERAIQATRGNYVAHNNLGTFYLGNGRLDEASREFLAAAAIMPDSVQTRSNLGLAYALQGRFEEAAAAFREALLLGPAPPQIHRNLGLALARLGRQGEAAAVFRQALLMEPEDPQTLYLLGVSLARQGLYADAVLALERAVGRDSRNATFAAALAVAREQLRLFRTLPQGSGE